MIGTSATTGKALTGLDHLRQSISDILTTPIGSRVMRRNYGSLIPGLIDQPMGPATRLRLYAASAHALVVWEPRLDLEAIALTESAAGLYQLSITGREQAGGTINAQVAL
ncbi:MAG: GPW/gp25 family protein [Candidatus Reddybacter sp.]